MQMKNEELKMNNVKMAGNKAKIANNNIFPFSLFFFPLFWADLSPEKRCREKTGKFFCFLP